MANTVLTFVIDTLEPKLDAILAAAINEIEAAGHKLKEVRVANDSGETKVAPNTIEGVNPPPAEEPAPEPAPEPTPAPEPAAPVDVPVDPTPVVADSSADATPA